MKLLVTVAFASVLSVATRAEASGAYGNSIASPSFRYTFEEHTRKSFINDKQATQFMAEHDREMKMQFLSFQAKAEKAIAEARTRGTPIGPYDLFLPAVRLKTATDVTKLAATAYPLNLVLDVSSTDATIRFEVTATKPWTESQITSLTASLGKIATTVDPNDGSQDRQKRDQAMLDAAGFEVPVAVTLVDDRFGLYVGTVTEVPRQDRARVVANLQATLDKLAPAVRKSLTATDAKTRLHVNELKPIKSLVGKDPLKLPNVFNPWGPLVTDTLVRMREDVGHVGVILMIAPRGKYNWGDVSPAMATVLRDAGLADPHRTLVEAEVQRLDAR